MEAHKTAAHRIAKHLREIARLLPELSAEGREAHLSGLELAPDDVFAEYVHMYADKAARLEATAPFEPVTEEDKQRVFEEVQDELGDESVRDRARNYLDLTGAEWRMEVDDRNEYMREENDDHDGDGGR